MLLKTTTAALAGLIAAQAVAADDLTVVSFGGANKVAQIKAFYAPWEQHSSSKVIAGEYNGEMARLKVMVDSRSVGWDVVEVELPELARGCDEGLFESLPEELFGSPSHYVSGAIQPCGVAFFIWSTVLAYNADKLTVAPTGWADFWDLRKYPGKRGLRKTAKFTLEFAWMADGVRPAEVYQILATKAGQDRAFVKLDQIKPFIEWWEAGAQPAQYLMSGDVVMSAAYNGRISAAQKESSLKVVWAGGIYDFDARAIPKGSKNVEAAKRFINFTLEPAQQQRFAQAIAYGPANLEAISQLDKSILEGLPTAEDHISQQVQNSTPFWADYGETLEQRFNAWVAK
ncbi:polyamine ABC transporter substrate-binding protein [Pseudomonas sp. SWI44]|uniref:polyamine ABC transporter substrate-binding protein n=1 Tax=Pseudomonas sp. SWI44 TaxID=2083053 RepID=UPI000CE5E116|nr:polyamine ABC transporter substrate-binding protein [Pseudomonas sp. SWI44]AVD89961.1 spermidine/putrescine ABC transporter substrate-binding protein [Pseudomonas sp. SWI44]